MKRFLITIWILMFVTVILLASDVLLNLESQLVGGYYDKADNMIWYSDSQKSEMQKPSLGFDLIQNFSNSKGNIASLSLQYRLAWNEQGSRTFEHQFYNAFLKVKTSYSDISMGHIKPAFGFNSYVDNHALLLHNFTMHGMGYDRDWGLLLNKDLDKSNISISGTLGSGMPIYTNGNYLLAGRYGYGVLNEDNYTVGASFFHGEALKTHGYHLISSTPLTTNYAGVDGRLFYFSQESNLDFLIGKKGDTDLIALMYRHTWNLLEENRMKLEIQPVWVKAEGNDNLKLGIGWSYRVLPDLTIRTLLEHDYDAKDYYAILQFYWYHNLFTGSI